ncbi:MAG: hypothetical protein Q9160_000414 [Pyrenula sp. 1 TL-2023]
MLFKLTEVTTDEEVGRLMEALYESYTHPYNGFWDMFKGQSDEEYIARYNEWRKLDPNVRWIYVTDTETDEVVGATQWNIYESNPFETDPPPLKAYWNEEGALYYPVIQWCGTKSAYRRRGIGMLMMKWGTERADQMGISSFVEATDLGEPLYRAAGFVTSHEFTFDASPDKPDEEWQSWRRKLQLPMHGFFMWRPIGGTWIKGETQFPWSAESSKA